MWGGCYAAGNVIKDTPVTLKNSCLAVIVLLYGPAAIVVLLTSGVRIGVHVTANNAKAVATKNQTRGRACASDTGTGAKTEDKLDELAGLMKSLMQAQTERDQQREKEDSCQE